MARVGAEEEGPLVLQVHRADWMVLERAAALDQTDVSGFILCHVLAAAHTLIGQAAAVTPSERDSLQVLDVLENPPAPRPKLLAAARRLPKHP